MNTHLHLLEAYTNLYRVWPDALLRARLGELIELFLDSIVGWDGHVRRFFDAGWTPRAGTVSFGHDIETSWLLAEAAEAFGDDALRERVAVCSLRIAGAVLASGYDAASATGGLFNERAEDGRLDTDKEWWPQAEAIVGFVNAYQESSDRQFLDAAWTTWGFVKRHLLDRQHGEWHRRVSRDGVLRSGFEKVGPWKCPYHSGRACLELMTRVNAGAAFPVLQTD
jgi:mannobiose 2-epimerase